ncbi:hypothetical protein [Streptomyces sp. NBC_00996]|uniref:hypothetical protein n=1 Tax=Streptomyces sp. NBC_00996 TaxID=2903710 RepID=UPI003862FA86|nr:hypothetical protein OG390_31070 [Streptomyces sp. NBC_00996]
MSTVPPPEQPDETSSISDDQWETFLRETAEGGGAPAPKEPSARARMVTRRLREADAAESNGRDRRRWRPRVRRRKEAPAPQPWTPAGWHTGPAWREINGSARRRRRVWSALGVVLAVAVAVVAVRPSLLLDRLPGHDSAASGPAASPSPLPAETASPSGAPGDVAQAAAPTRDHPFLGSPAQAWAEGADAIELPHAKAIGGMSKDDVALALRRTKEYLVATNLDPAVLRGGQPTRALAVLDPKGPDVSARLRRSLRDPDREHDPVDVVTRFNPDEVRLTGKVIKVRGRMTFTAGRPGEVQVHADYTFVYPLVQAHGAGDHVERTIVRREVTMVLADPRRWSATQGKLFLKTYNAEYSNIRCGIYDGYLQPYFLSDTPSGAPATGPAEDPYDRSRPLPDPRKGQDDACGTVTRT